MKSSTKFSRRLLRSRVSYFSKGKFTRELGAFVGRAVPVVGWVITAADLSVIMYRSVLEYNRLVKPEDRF